MNCFRSICFWSWPRAFLILLTLISLGLSIFELLEYNDAISPLPIVGCLINIFFIITILTGIPCLIKYYAGLFVIYALALIILVTSSHASSNIIDYPYSRVHSDADDALTISVKALILVGLSWFLVAGQIIGSMLYLKDLQDFGSGLASRYFLTQINLKDSYEQTSFGSFSGSFRDSPL